jgi:sugar phosphate permease
MKNTVFVCLALTIAGLYFLTAGIQYWISDYLQTVLELPKDEVYYVFSFVCLTAPFTGIIGGGSFFGSLGGYNDPRALKYSVYILFVGIIDGFTIPLTSERWIVYICFWLLFFIGAFTLPTLTGIMLNSIE